MNSAIFHDLIRVSVSLLPVFFFLAGLILIDSYRLVKVQSVLISILMGCVAALFLLLLDVLVLRHADFNFTVYSRYGAPVLEEITKAVYLIYLIRSQKIGFMVDAAIHGFAIGAGFALLENIHYLRSLPDATLFIWIIRGFGTAVMHGGVTAIFGIISKNLFERRESSKYLAFLSGLTLAMVIHSFFNHFILPPVQSTLVILFVFPVIIAIVYYQSEKSTQHWLGIGFDTDQELLELITSGDFSESRIGRYLHSLRAKLSGEIVADMLCLLRLHVELSIHAKGILMKQEAGFRVSPDPEIKEKFEELRYLEKNIGTTGHLAMTPFLHTSEKHLWQLHMLGGKQ